MLRIVDEAGRFPAGRGAGAQVRDAVIDQLSAQDLITLSFEGVEVVTPSFADELFGGLLAELGEEQFRRRIRVSGTDPEVAAWIRHALARKSRQLQVTA